MKTRERGEQNIDERELEGTWSGIRVKITLSRLPFFYIFSQHTVSHENRAYNIKMREYIFVCQVMFISRFYIFIKKEKLSKNEKLQIIKCL